MTADVLVVGSGLLGTSLGLALQGVRDVALSDTDPAVLQAALARRAGRRLHPGETASLVVLCVPLPALPDAVVGALREHPNAVVTHVGSVQGLELPADERLCGGHPMAGRETAGPEHAVAALFAGRPWFVCPGQSTSERAHDAVERLARDVGAEPVTTTPDRHDRTVALVSHLPQVVASALAAQLLRGAPGDPERAGPGLVDTTRLAGSPPALWHDVLQANAAQVSPLLRTLAQDLLAAADGLEAGDLGPVDDLLLRGGQGRALVPVKRGQRDEDLVAVRVALPDTPGMLAAVLQAAGTAGVNVEDLRLDHLPGRPSGTLELLVAGGARAPLEQALRADGLLVEQQPGTDAPAR
ncbi:MAG: prephenate dehydrogenase [Frankiales bacterium]|nr:prephenate dehydrogenase [Frankiales bacterium]